MHLFFLFCLYLSSVEGASLTMDPGAWGAASTDRRVTRSARRHRTFIADIGILMGSMMTLSGVGSPFIPRI